MSLLPGSFSNLGIQCVKKKEIEAAIEKKLQLGIDPFKGWLGGLKRSHSWGLRCYCCGGSGSWGTTDHPLLSPSWFPQEPSGGGRERGEDLLPGLLQGQLWADTAPQPSAIGAHLRQEYVVVARTSYPSPPPFPPPEQSLFQHLVLGWGR